MLTQENFNINEVTMSSLEIVDFINEYRAKTESNPVQLRHDHFMAKVPKVLGENQSPIFLGDYKDPKGRTYPCYHFPKREACLMAMSYSYELQAQIFDRMTAMEEALKAKNSFDITNPEHLLQAIEVQAKLNIELTEKVAVLSPKAEALDQIADTSSSFCIREAAKTIGLSQNKLIEFMLNKRWIYRNNDRKHTLCAYAERCTQGVMTNKVTQIISTPEGDQVYTQARITAFGLTRLTALVQKAGLVQGVAA